MKTGSNNHKRVIMAAAIFLAMSAIAVGAGIFLHAVTGDEEILLLPIFFDLKLL